MNSKNQQIVINGVEYATPESFSIENDVDLWGWFAPEGNDQYYSSLYWGEATPENLAAIRAAGVEIN